MDDQDLNDHDEQLKNLMGLGSSSIRKSYYPELQNSINELKIEKDRFERIFSDALNGIFQADLGGKILIANPAMIKLCGYQTMEELQLLENIGSDLFAENILLDDLFSKISKEGSVIGFESKFKTFNGSIIDVSLNASIIQSENTEFLECFVQNISERKKAENSLKKAQTYISNIVNSMPSTLIGVDPKGYITQWNKEAENTFSITAKMAIGKILEEVLPYIKDEIISIKNAIENKEKYMGIRRSRIKDKKILYEDISIFPLIANGVDGAVIRIDDVTEKVRIDEMMVQSEKMLSIGGLAAGMAHEINNPLAGIMQTAGVMTKRLTDKSIPANIKAAEKAGIDMDAIENFMLDRGIMRMLNAINESGKRAAGIIENMLSFSRKGDSTYSSHDPVELINNILDLAATDFDLKKQYDFKNIHIIKEFEADIPFIPCIKSQLQQVILNILRNGAESMSEIDETVNQSQFIIRLKKESKMICIEIEDNGPGMDKKTSNRIFEPFFTTKPVGIGTGLGLSVSYFIINNNHNGTLEVKSEPGQGSNFVIRLPLSR